MIDITELGRRAGAMTRITDRVPAPAHLGGEVSRVPAGSELALDLRLESVVDGVLVTGVVRARGVGECARCLDDLEFPLEVEIQEMYAYEEYADETTSTVEDGLLDLEPVVHDAVVLALPLAPVCKETCPGLCSLCGARLADEPDHRHEDVDPRWAALATLAVPDEPAGE